MNIKQIQFIQSLKVLGFNKPYISISEEYSFDRLNSAYKLAKQYCDSLEK